MIGWRPFLLTGIALLLIAVVVLDVRASMTHRPASCAVADALSGAGASDEARAQYVSVLKQDPKSTCAKAGLVDTPAK